MVLYYSSPSKLAHLLFALMLNSADIHLACDLEKDGLYILFIRTIVIGNVGTWASPR